MCLHVCAQKGNKSVREWEMKAVDEEREEKGGENRCGPNRLEISRLLPARRSACKSEAARSDTRDPQKNYAEREK